AAGKQRDIVTQRDELLTQPRDHTFGTTIQLGRHSFGEVTMTSTLRRTNSATTSAKRSSRPLAPAIFDSNSAAFAPTKFAQSLHKRGDPFAARGTRALPKETDGRHLAGLLRARCEWPSHRRPTKHRYEFAALHSIASSARSRKDSGMPNPIALAVLRLTTNSNLTGCSIGRSAGLVPCKILCTYTAPRRNRSGRLAP